MLIISTIGFNQITTSYYEEGGIHKETKTYSITLEYTTDNGALLERITTYGDPDVIKNYSRILYTKESDDNVYFSYTTKDEEGYVVGYIFYKNEKKLIIAYDNGNYSTTVGGGLLY